MQWVQQRLEVKLSDGMTNQRPQRIWAPKFAFRGTKGVAIRLPVMATPRPACYRPQGLAAPTGGCPCRDWMSGIRKSDMMKDC